MPLHGSVIPTFTLPSLDPPGEKLDLCPPYNQPPFKRGVLTNEVRQVTFVSAPVLTADTANQTRINHEPDANSAPPLDSRP